MFFERTEDILKLASKCGTAIFVVPDDVEVDIKNAIVLKPEDKTVITIEQVRQVIQRLAVKQVNEQYIIVRPAELMNEEAANAFLKNLEEPKEKVHFVLITSMPSMILPTIMSRANLYIMKKKWAVDAKISANEDDMILAKRLMVAKPEELVTVVEEIVKKKEIARERALRILGIVIEMLYRTYLINGKEVFLTKLPKFLQAYESISRNGHVKLHLVADLC